MSIIVVEGFDLYDAGVDNETNISVRRGIWTAFNNLSFLTYESRNNGNAMSSTQQLTWVKSQAVAPVSQHMIFGCAVRVNQEPSGTGSEFLDLFLLNGQFAFRIFTFPPVDNQFNDFRLGYTTDPVSVSKTILPTEYARDSWHYVEGEFDSVAGALRIWMNGSLVLDTTIPTGTDTQDFSVNVPPQHTVDDFYWLDGADASQGAAFQANLGPIQVRPVPLSSDQTPSELISSQGGAKYLDVGEQPGGNDKDATYMYTQQAPRTQNFGVTATDALLPILALTAHAVVKQVAPNVGAAKLSFVAEDTVAVESSPTPALEDTYRMYWEDYVVMPDGTSIDAPKVEAAKWGVKVLPES